MRLGFQAVGTIVVFCRLAFTVPQGLAQAPLPDGSAGKVTLVLNFERRGYSPASVRELKRELDSLMRHSGLGFDWSMVQDAYGKTFSPPLVMVNFLGNCSMRTRLEQAQTSSAMAWAYVSNGQVRPFIALSCESICAFIRSAMWGGEFNRQDFLLGRALARVLAHELYHVLGNACFHGQSGVARHALSGRQLIDDHLEFQPVDLQRIVANASRQAKRAMVGDPPNSGS